MPVLTTVLLILIGILLFSFIIFAHEFGHFITAKASGIKVNEFALGMGPKIFSFGKGETKYSLRAFPIGGFCAMEGEDEESEDVRAFNNKSVWKRMIVIVAGAVMNMIVGLLFVAILLGQKDVFVSTTIAKFSENSATEAAGLAAGDEFYSIDGYRIHNDRDLSFALSLANPESVDLVVLREGEKLRFDNVRFNTVEEDGKEILALDFYVYSEKKTFFSFLGRVFSETVSLVRMVWTSLIGLVTGRFGLKDVAGPVGAAQAISQAASIGLESGLGAAINNILLMMAVITVNLGIVNLLPLPALDGGRFLFLVIEAIRGKPISPKYEGWVHAAGFILLIGLMVLITFNDLIRIFTGKGLGG